MRLQNCVGALELTKAFSLRNSKTKQSKLSPACGQVWHLPGKRLREVDRGIRRSIGCRQADVLASLGQSRLPAASFRALDHLRLLARRSD